MKANRFSFKLLLLSALFLCPGYLYSQDLTESEIEKVQQIRQSLIQEQPDIMPLQTHDADPIIINSVYTGKRSTFSTSATRDTDFRPNGSRIYLVGRASNNIAEYHLSTNWDIETASYVRELDISSEMGSASEPDSAPHGLFIRKSDGEKMWVFNRTEIWEYTLSTPWDITSASPTGYNDLSDNHVRAHSIDFHPDGNRFYVDDRAVGGVFQYNLSTNWDIETANLDYMLNISGEQEEVRGVELNGDGSKLFLMDTVRQEVLEFYLSTPYDLRSASFLATYSVRSQTTDPRDITFRPNFRDFYITSSEEDRVYQYEILTPDPDESIVTANREKVVANDESTSRIIVTVRDEDGNRLQGLRVRLSSDSGTSSIISVNSTTNSNGEARFDVRNSVEEEVTYTARASNVTINQTATVRFVGVDSEESSVAANREKVIANGSGTARISVTVRDEDGDELEGVRITLNTNSSTAQVSNVNRNTDSDGVARFDASNTVQETVTFTASGMGTEIDESVSVRYVGVDADESSISSNRKKVLSNGSATATITVTARDEDGVELPDVDITLEPLGGSSDISNAQNVTDSDGRATFRVSNNTNEVVEYAAEGLGTTLSETVFVNFVTVNPSLSTVSVSPQRIQADGEDRSTITVMTLDDDGDPLQGARVELIEESDISSIEELQNVTDSNAEAFFRVSSSTSAVVNYRVVAEGLELDQQAEVQFVPVAPVALSASGVETRQFTANWELVSGADNYLLDVATDSDFTNFIPGHQSRDVGQQTSFLVEGVDPGTEYFYRVRAEADGLIGNNSQTISTTTFPETPVASEPTNRSTLQFRANWQPAEGARNYRLDVALDEDFENFVSGFEDKEVGEETFADVTGLEAGTTYFYRVRAEAGTRLSGYSNTIEMSTFSINSENSQISSSQLRVLANGNQANVITVVVKSDEGIELEGIGVRLVPQSGNSQVDEVQSVTDEDGVAIFEVTNTSAQEVTYKVEAANVDIGDISVEFLQDDGRLELGNNFPNPFNIETIIPFTIPQPMQVNLTVYNSLGSPVRELLNEEMPSGYYEILFQGRELASGVYFYRLVTSEGTKTSKMIMVK